MNSFNKIKKRARDILELALALLFVIMCGQAKADVDEKNDWSGQKRHLTVCLDNTNCPAGTLQALQDAIAAWNALNISWTFEYVADCATADVKVKCATIKGLGLWEVTQGTYGAATKEEITINKDSPDWGYCDDKLELKSTLVHELGHCARLNDVAGQADQMRGTQDKQGHSSTPSAADKKEAEQSDPTKKKDADTVPPGGKKQVPYDGIITPTPGDAPFNLDDAISIAVIPLDPLSLLDIHAHVYGGEMVGWQCNISDFADLSEAFTLQINYGDSVVNRQGYLSVVDNSWDESWLPMAIAPADTTVPYAFPTVVLDASASMHPAGLGAMDFQWWIDDGLGGVIKGDSVTSADLSPGSHVIELKAQDDFGNWSSDFMNVYIEGPGGCQYVPGDANGNHSFNGLDVSYSVAYFKGGPPPPYTCECPPGYTWYVAGDVNASCSFNGVDISYMVFYFKGGPSPRPCPDCPPMGTGGAPDKGVNDK